MQIAHHATDRAWQISSHCYSPCIRECGASGVTASYVLMEEFFHRCGDGSSVIPSQGGQVKKCFVCTLSPCLLQKIKAFHTTALCGFSKWAQVNAALD